MPYRDINVGDKVVIASADGAITYNKISLSPFEINGSWKVMVEGSTVFVDADTVTVLYDHGDHPSGPPRGSGVIQDRNLMNGQA